MRTRLPSLTGGSRAFLRRCFVPFWARAYTVAYSQPRLSGCRGFTFAAQRYEIGFTASEGQCERGNYPLVGFRL